MKLSACLLGENRLPLRCSIERGNSTQNVGRRTLQRLFYRVLRIETSKTILKTGTEDLSVRRHQKNATLFLSPSHNSFFRNSIAFASAKSRIPRQKNRKKQERDRIFKFPKLYFRQNKGWDPVRATAVGHRLLMERKQQNEIQWIEMKSFRKAPCRLAEKKKTRRYRNLSRENPVGQRLHATR